MTVDEYVRHWHGSQKILTQKVELETAPSSLVVNVHEQTSTLSPTYKFLSEGGSITTSPGDLHALVVSEGSDANGAVLEITLWDNTVSGGTAVITAFPVSSGNVYDLHDVRFTTGLFATFTNSATSDYQITVLYRNT